MLSQKIKRILQALDQHGAPIHLTYNGQTNHQTATGGVLTILSRLGILAYFFVLVNDIVNKEKTIQTSYIAKSPTTDYQNYSIEPTDFDIAFTLSFFDNGAHYEERINYQKYFNIMLFYEETIYINNTDGTLTRYINPTATLEFGNCTLDRFAGLGNEMIIRGLNQPGWFCPNKIDVHLWGQTTSMNQNRMKFQVFQCVNSTSNNNGCATADEISAISKLLFVQIATLNTFFDESQFDGQPIKRSINIDQYPLAFGMNQMFVKTLKKTEVTTKDNWISSQFGNKQYTYYEEQPLYNKFGYHVEQLLTIGWCCDGQEQFISRKVLSLSDAAATAGGFAGIILLITKLFSRLYCNQLYQKSIFSEIYRSEIPTDEKAELYQQYKDGNEEIKNGILAQIVKRRTIFVTDTIKYQLMHFFCFWRTIRDRNYKQYQQAKKRLNNQLDIRHILEAMNQLKSMEKILMKDYQRKALKFTAEHEIRIDKDYQNKEELNQLDQQDVFKTIIQNDQKSMNRKLINEIFGISKIDKKQKENIVKISNNSGNHLKFHDKNNFQPQINSSGQKEIEEDEENSLRMFIGKTNQVKKKTSSNNNVENEDVTNLKRVKSTKKKPKKNTKE